MIRKHGFNIVFFAFIAILFSTISCVNPGKPSGEGQLMKADRDFSAMSVKEGMHRAFLRFIADSGVILRNNNWPVKGRNRLAELYAGSSDTSFVLEWEPLFEKVSSGGDLGYTYGTYKSRVRATGEEESGMYITVWQRQHDGSWKFVLDTGTHGLPPVSK